MAQGGRFVMCLQRRKCGHLFVSELEVENIEVFLKVRLALRLSGERSATVRIGNPTEGHLRRTLLVLLSDFRARLASTAFERLPQRRPCLDDNATLAVLGDDLCRSSAIVVVEANAVRLHADITKDPDRATAEHENAHTWANVRLKHASAYQLVDRWHGGLGAGDTRHNIELLRREVRDRERLGCPRGVHFFERLPLALDGRIIRSWVV